jgi:hypothetical protein
MKTTRRPRRDDGSSHGPTRWPTYQSTTISHASKFSETSKAGRTPRGHLANCEARKLAPRVGQLSSELRDATGRDLEFRGDLARRVPQAEALGDSLVAGRQVSQPPWEIHPKRDLIGNGRLPMIDQVSCPHLRWFHQCACRLYALVSFFWGFVARRHLRSSGRSLRDGPQGIAQSHTWPATTRRLSAIRLARSTI